MNNYYNRVTLCVFFSFFTALNVLNAQQIEKFIIAARDGDLETVKELLETKKVSVNDRVKKFDNQTALMAALFRKTKFKKDEKTYTTQKIQEKLNVAKYLLSKGADPAIISSNKQTASRLLETALAKLKLDKDLMKELAIESGENLSLDEINEQIKLYQEMKSLLESKLNQLSSLHDLTLNFTTLATLAA